MAMTYVIFYIMTAFVQAYSKSPAKLSSFGFPTGLGIAPNTFTGFLLVAAIVFGIFTSISGIGADKIGRRKWLIGVTILCMVFACFMPMLLSNGTPTTVFIFLILGMACMGMSFGPMAALLPELFPTEVRYSGASLAYNLAAIVGASIPAIYAIKINEQYGMKGVAIYIVINGLISLIALFSIKETKNIDLMD